MIKERPFLEKHDKKIDYIIFAALLVGALILGWWWSAPRTYDHKTNQVVEGTPASVDTFDYELFWHKFNTYSVIMINLKNTQHLVSQQEVQQFQDQFFKKFGLIKEPNDAVERGGTEVDPNILFCYMKKYEPSSTEVNDIIKSCIQH